jgi:hypothetical protein
MSRAGSADGLISDLAHRANDTHKTEVSQTRKSAIKNQHSAFCNEVASGLLRPIGIVVIPQGFAHLTHKFMVFVGYELLLAFHFILPIYLLLEKA